MIMDGHNLETGSYVENIAVRQFLVEVYMFLLT